MIPDNSLSDLPPGMLQHKGYCWLREGIYPQPKPKMSPIFLGVLGGLLNFTQNVYRSTQIHWRFFSPHQKPHTHTAQLFLLRVIHPFPLRVSGRCGTGDAGAQWFPAKAMKCENWKVCFFFGGGKFQLTVKHTKSTWGFWRE